MPSGIGPLFDSGARHTEVADAARELLSVLLADAELDARKHPLGFVHVSCARFATQLRLHLWPPQRTVQDPELLIHDHTFGFRSRVLLGSVQNVVYSIRETQCAKKELYYVEYDGIQSTLSPTGVRVDLIEVARTRMMQFGLYEMEAGGFHESLVDADTLSCTVLHTVPSTASPPRVVGPYAALARRFKREEVRQDEVRSLIHQVLERLASDSLVP